MSHDAVSAGPSLGAVRSICLAFPEAVEQITWGHPTFRVKGKIFASYGWADDNAEVVTMKAAAGEQEVLLAEGSPVFYPKYVGSKGWIGVVIDAGTDFDEIAELVEDSYREIAPKRLAAQLDTA